MANDNHPVDAITGTATTGHEWDGIRELNTPLPRWWLWLFYATIVWAIGYWVVYPSWPLLSSYMPGALNWHARSAVVADLEALKAQRAPMVNKLTAASVSPTLRPTRALRRLRASPGPAGLRGQLRAVPRRRRGRRQGISESQ